MLIINQIEKYEAELDWYTLSSISGGRTVTSKNVLGRAQTSFETTSTCSVIHFLKLIRYWGSLRNVRYNDNHILCLSRNVIGYLPYVSRHPDISRREADHLTIDTIFYAKRQIHQHLQKQLKTLVLQPDFRYDFES